MTDQQRSDALHRILDRANRLSTVIEDLLLVTQLERGDVEELVDPTPVDLADIVSGVVRDATERAAGRTITFSVDPTTPEALADPPRVRQIVGALVDNAVRYSPTDLPVEVTLDAADDMVRIAVVDHGQGIAAGDRQRVFEQFQRLEDPMTMRTTGVGLGLFIARRLALAMGGTLDLEPGQDAGRDDGSVFVLHLPSVKEVQAADGPATSGDLTVTDQDVAPS